MTEIVSNLGPSTDKNNNPVIDPTQNVLDLVEAAIRRQDDLRESEADHIRTLSEIRSYYENLLREKESARIDAIRAVDVGFSNRAAEDATTRAATLAAQVAVSAETLRTQVAASATAAAIALAAALEPVQKDIADLRRAQYEAQGQKTQVVENQANGNYVVGLIGMGITILILVISFISYVVSNSGP